MFALYIDWTKKLLQLGKRNSRTTWGSQSSYKYRRTSVLMEDGSFGRDVPTEYWKLVGRTRRSSGGRDDAVSSFPPLTRAVTCVTSQRDSYYSMARLAPNGIVTSAVNKLGFFPLRIIATQRNFLPCFHRFCTNDYIQLLAQHKHPRPHNYVFITVLLRFRDNSDISIGKFVFSSLLIIITLSLPYAQIGPLISV